ncbi:hypothetical protein KKG81_13270 [bacterium]|nr:hypothetical protein [bacterium]
MVNKQKIVKAIKEISFGFTTGFTILTVFLFVGVMFFPESMFIGVDKTKEIKGSLIEKIYKRTSIQHYEPYSRSLAVNLTRGCKTDNYCYLSRIYTYMSSFDYVQSGNENAVLYPPKQILKDKAGDCKNLAMAFASMINEVGLKNDFKLSEKQDHIWNQIYIDHYIFKVDLTIPKLILISNSSAIENVSLDDDIYKYLLLRSE